eukprot:CAMPEP_0171104266 /NCGR_PEP_ID=MMETSP0766_2-20121228/60320_1 /TAXON_ID=439317 /ORGANISM="Gambierdiscus australes, Strain CAWD 149" /LENGTH=107 /DNA_ID=CAMNT_0011564867 /DNA_START=280 /DNA_END=599 /DNA_ORIENTATION=-
MARSSSALTALLPASSVQAHLSLRRGVGSGEGRCRKAIGSVAPRGEHCAGSLRWPSSKNRGGALQGPHLSLQWFWCRTVRLETDPAGALMAAGSTRSLFNRVLSDGA